MEAILRSSELFQGLDDEAVSAHARLAQPRTVRPGEYVFLLGDRADRIYVVLRGAVDLCLPVKLKGVLTDAKVESKPPGSAVGWSALVRPYRVTLSARAAEPTELAGFLRQDLLGLFAESPRAGYGFMLQLVEVLGRRLATVQALWARQLQRSVDEGLGTGTVSETTGR